MVEWLANNSITEPYYHDVIEHIAQYYSVAQRAVIESINLLDLGKIKLYLPWQKKMFDLFISQSMGGYIRSFSCQEIDVIKNSSVVIIYGAGKIGRDAIIYLSGLGVNSFLIAVTHAKDNEYIMGNKVYNIADIKCDKKEAAVLIAIKGKAKDDIFSNLVKMGYKNIIKLTNN